jgi:hypothetical protein
MICCSFRPPATCRLRPPPMDAPFVNCLPPELLIAIATFIPDQSAIFRLATVCGCWYNVLTGTPAVWTSIDCRRGSRTAILLQRSKFYPIDVTIDHPFSPQAVSLVTRHAYRMRSINMNLPSDRFGEIRSLLHTSAPILETMSLGHIPTSPPYSSFFRGRFPALRTLRLEGYPFDLARSTPRMTNGLTTLVFNNTQHHHLRDLLEYLEHCKNLVFLRIDLPNLQGTLPTSRVVSLPNLRGCGWSTCPLLSTTFLFHLLRASTSGRALGNSPEGTHLRACGRETDLSNYTSRTPSGALQ